MKQQESTIEAGVSPIAYLMKNYADYNLWANASLVNWLRTKPADLLEKDVASSFNSIKATAAHIVSVQQSWLSIIRGDEAPANFEQFNGSLEEVLTALVELSDELADCVKQLSDDAVEGNILVITPWFQSDLKNFEYIMQVINHGTYHRGQIITIGRNLGFTNAPMTDYIFYHLHGK